MILTFKSAFISEVSDLFPQLINISAEAIDFAEYNVMRRLIPLASRYHRIVLAYDDEELVGCTVYGNSTGYIPWMGFLKLKYTLGMLGYDTSNFTTPSIIILRKKYWSGGYHKQLLQAWAADAVKQGFTTGFFSGTITKKLAIWATTLPGASIVEDFVDGKGHPMTIFDLEVLKGDQITTKIEK